MHKNINKLVLAGLALLVVPQIVFASWWNPFSWQIFNDEDSVSNIESKYGLPDATTTENVASVVTRFYVKYDNTRIRTCPSTDCKILGYYKKNDEIIVTDFRTVTLSDFPEWILFSLPETKTAYINKSVLSETPVKITPTVTVTEQQRSAGSQISEADKQAVISWLTDMGEAKKSARQMMVDLNDSANPGGASSGIMDVLENYEDDVTSFELKLSTVLNNFDINTAKTLIRQYQETKTEFGQNLNTAIAVAQEKADIYYRAKKEARQDAINDYYRETRAQQGAINQAQLDALNARIEEYNRIRKEGAANGVTEAVINAQLNAAGLIKQINCYTSPVGGMTPSGGSVTCY